MAAATVSIQTPSRPADRWSRWLPALVSVTALAIIGLLIGIIPIARTVIAGTDRRNQADLSIAAAGLEQWSASVATLARANFIKGQVVSLTPAERDYGEGWRYRTWLRHPALNEFKINYVVTNESGCTAIRAGITEREGSLPFVADYNGVNAYFLKIVDSFPLAQIRAQDARPMRETADPGYLRTIVSSALNIAVKKPVVCFAVGIPLDRLLVLDRAARAFSNLLIVDAQGRIAVQMGAERLPVRSLAGLVPETSVLARTLAVSVGGKSPAAPVAGKLADSLKPVEVEIGGRAYIAYVRPLVPPSSFEACVPAAAKAVMPVIALTVGPAATAASAATAVLPSAKERDPETKPAASDCLVVALMPRATLWRQVLILPPMLRIALGVGAVAFIALLPSLRLILLGPGEAIGRGEAVGVALGIPAAASLATLALLFAADLGTHRADAERRAKVIATDAAERVGANLRDVTEMVERASAKATVASFPLVDTVKPPRNAKARAAHNRVPVHAHRKSRTPFVADPVPRENIEAFCERWPNGLPKVDSVGLIDEDGQQAAGSRAAACRHSLGGRVNVSARDYFQRLRVGQTSLIDGTTAGGTPYVLAHVASLQDGIAKAIVGMRTKLGDDDKPRGALYAVGGAVLVDAVAPVLPPSFTLMIVDTRDRALPVLLDATPGRSGAERLAAMVRNPEDVRQALRDLHLPSGDQAGRTTRFAAYYDGAERHFIAAPISGSRWVAVVSYSLSDIDGRAVNTAVAALRSWATFSILFTVAWVVWLAGRGRRGWPRLWPAAAYQDRYRRLAVWLGIVGGVSAVVIVAIGMSAPAVAVMTGLGVRLAAALLLHVDLGRGVAVAEILGPAVQRDYKRMLIALILCISIVPMLGFWQEAHDYAGQEYRRSALAELTEPDGALARNRLGFDRLRWTFGLDSEPSPGPWTTTPPGTYGVAWVLAKSIPVNADRTIFSAFFDEATGRDPEPLVDECTAPTLPDDNVIVCGDGKDRRYGIGFSTSGLFGSGLLQLFGTLVAALACVGMLDWVLKRVLRGLAGFGIPLEAFVPPTLFVGDLWGKNKPPDAVVLNRKSLLVNAPYIILAMLRRGGVDLSVVNVATAKLARIRLEEGSVIVFIGLELVLADRDRRLNALALLEHHAATLARLGPQTRSRILVMSESAPLERILDAFERDSSRSAVDGDRENLRWSRLFEDFATYNFRLPRITGSIALQGIIDTAAAGNALQQRTITAVSAEFRWLPQRVASSTIGEEIFLPDVIVDAAIVPINDTTYQQAFEKPIVDWAKQRAFPGKAAVRAHMRNQCIEYYQKLWSASTTAEHLVLHNMASSRFVNIGNAIAFASLVRRGIIVFDPEPRLMNASFAMFVRLAEKLDTIRYLQSQLPRSAWVMARLPIFAVLGTLIAGLVALVAISGEDVTAMLPVLAAGIPALIATGQRAFKR